MTTDILSSNRKNAYKLLYLQSTLVLLAVIAWAATRGFPSAWSALLGGIAWLLPSFYFARKLFIMRTNKLPSPQRLVKKFFIAELLKLLFSATLIILFIKLLPVIIMPFLSGYIGAVIACWFTPYAYKNI